jgi:hemolysin activation/secretion protein
MKNRVARMNLLLLLSLLCAATAWSQTLDLAVDTAVANPPGAFFVTRIATSESKILSAEEIRQITSRYEQRRLTKADLDQLIADFNQLYAKKGFATARAMLPVQTIHDGVVKIQLIEARVGNVMLSSNTRTRESFFRDRVSIPSGEILQLSDVQKKLAYFNATNDLQMRAVLKPGEALGTTDLSLEAQGPRDFEVTAFTDNAGRNTIGVYRAGANVVYRSVFGERDPLAISFVGADGTLAGNESYSFPLDTKGTRVGAQFDYDSIAINGGVLGSTEMTGHSVDGSLSLSRPLLAQVKNVLSANLSAHYKYSVLSSEGIPVIRTLVRSMELSADYERFDSRGAWIVSNTLAGGFYDITGATNFFHYDGSLARTVLFSRKVTGIVRVSGQTAAMNSLPTIEQYQIGGASSVRGYPEAALTGDRGFTASEEEDFAFLPKPWSERIQAAIFVDGGAVFGKGLSTANQPADSRLLSPGFGFPVKLPSQLTARVDFGIPVRNKVGISSVAIHFSLQKSFGFPNRKMQVFGKKG